MASRTVFFAINEHSVSDCFEAALVMPCGFLVEPMSSSHSNKEWTRYMFDTG